MRRGAFALLSVVLFMVLVATLGAFVLSLSTQNVKQTTDLYLRAQGELLLRSSAEFALLAISGHRVDTTNGCLKKINTTYPKKEPLFDINITIHYFGRGVGNNCNILSNAVQEDESNVTVMLDIFVTTKKQALYKGVATEPIRLHRRTLQKP